MKHLLELTNLEGVTILIDADSIIAIEKDSIRENVSRVYCNWVPHPFTVKKNHFVIFNKLKELGIVQLQKFD
jgi:hypothetical protein